MRVKGCCFDADMAGFICHISKTQSVGGQHMNLCVCVCEIIFDFACEMFLKSLLNLFLFELMGTLACIRKLDYIMKVCNKVVYNTHLCASTEELYACMRTKRKIEPLKDLFFFVSAKWKKIIRQIGFY